MKSDGRQGKSAMSEPLGAYPRAFAVLALSAVCLGLCCVAASTSSAVTLEEVAADFELRKEDVQRILDGELIETKVKESAERELAVAMLFLVEASVQKLFASIEAGPSSRNDPQVQAVSEIRGEGTLDQLNAVVLRPGGEKEMQRYLDVEPGDALNLSTAEMATFAALKGAGGAGQAQVEEAVRQVLLARYQAYREQGLAGIAPYARGKGKQSQPADDLRRTTEAAKGVKKHAPAFYDALMKYPQGRPAGLKEQFFCIRYAASGRPNFALRHQMVLAVDDAYVVADRDFYVSSGYNDSQAVAGFIPVENGTVVFYVNRTTTDQLAGFGAAAKQSIGRGMMAKQISEIFDRARAGFKKK